MCRASSCIVGVGLGLCGGLCIQVTCVWWRPREVVGAGWKVEVGEPVVDGGVVGGEWRWLLVRLVPRGVAAWWVPGRLCAVVPEVLWWKCCVGQWLSYGEVSVMAG